MSAMMTCPHPARCGGSRRHRVGSVAANACLRPLARVSMAPAPTSPSMTPGRAWRESMQQRLDEADAAAGWGGRGRPHPTGGYVSRALDTSADRSTAQLHHRI